jgi:hypothetical protein
MAAGLTTCGARRAGHPFNTPLMENQGMKKSITWGSFVLALLVSEGMPQFNE